MWVQAFIHDFVFSIPPKAIQFVVRQRVWFGCYCSLFVSSWREKVLLIHTSYMILVRAQSCYSAPVLRVFSPWHSLSIRKCWWMCNNAIKVCATNNLCALFHIVIKQSKRFFLKATMWFYNARRMDTWISFIWNVVVFVQFRIVQQCDQFLINSGFNFRLSFECPLSYDGIYQVSTVARASENHSNHSNFKSTRRFFSFRLRKPAWFSIYIE